MKTFIAKPQEVNKKWYIVDAKDKVPGRIATTIANKLRGKDKAIFSPHMDCGDFVIIINAEKIKLTGNKMEDKLYHRHSGYPGGLKSVSASTVLERNPSRIIEFAVRGMLPKNRLRKLFMKKLKIFVGEEHPHAAQSPEVLEV